MPNLTTTSLLDNVLASIQDNSIPMRTKVLNWLNNAIQDIAAERDWLCLQTTAVLPVASPSGTVASIAPTTAATALTKPDDYGRMVEIIGVGTPWVLTQQHHLSDVLFYGMRNVSGMFNAPVGWVEDSTELVMLNAPGVSEVVLTYIPALPTYAEGDTVPFPLAFSNYFQRSLLTTYYEYDMDERMAFSAQQKVEELKQLKHWENQLLRPRAAYTRRYGLVNTDAR